MTGYLSGPAANGHALHRVRDRQDREPPVKMELHGHDAPLEGEERKERLDRELGEMLEEVRVALPGVQVLFAFLLALPFQGRWDTVTALQQRVYFGSLCLALVASALLIAPSAYHRSNFRAYDKARLIVLGSRMALAGIAALAAAMVGVLFVVADALFSHQLATATAIGAALVFGALWWALPLRDRLHFAHAAEEGEPVHDDSA